VEAVTGVHHPVPARSLGPVAAAFAPQVRPVKRGGLWVACHGAWLAAQAEAMSTSSPASPDPGSASDATRALERGLELTPRFGADGLIAAVAQDHVTREVLMVAWMDAQALQRTLETGQAHYWSRSRGALWLKGETSGQIQTVRELRIDCDQDAVLLLVEVGGDGGCCHVGFRACFYRAVAAPDGTLVQVEPDPGTGGHVHPAPTAG
jgi:phosphoribosyl-AMP cyclohydrolase